MIDVFTWLAFPIKTRGVFSCRKLGLFYELVPLKENMDIRKVVQVDFFGKTFIKIGKLAFLVYNYNLKDIKLLFSALFFNSVF